MISLEQEALKVSIGPIIKINESSMAYAIVDMLYHHSYGVHKDLLEAVIIPKRDRTPENFFQFLETTRELYDMGLTCGSNNSLTLTPLGSEIYRADRAAKVTILSCVRSELEKEGNLTRDKIEEEINKDYLLTLKNIQQNIIEAVVD